MRKCILPLLLVAAGGATGVPAVARADELRSLEGVWVMESAYEIHADGSRTTAYGEHPRGLLNVDRANRYNLQIFRPDRPAFASGDNPFGSIPTYEEGGLALFESGAIVLHIAQRHPGLLPDDGPARARAVAWMFAALNTVEQPIVEHEVASFFEADRPWRDEHLAMVADRVRDRLRDLSNRLGDADWLEGEFSAADLIMVLVLRRLDDSGIVEEFPTLAAYVARGEARPAYARAFAAQAAVFAAAALPRG